MEFKRSYITQFHDTAEDGIVGLSAYMNLFQDAATSFMHDIGKGNDTILETYGCAWVYTKYRLEISEYCNTAEQLKLKLWVSAQTRLGVTQAFTISSGEKMLAAGRLESYLINMESQKICPLTEIEYPDDTVTEKTVSAARFSRLPKKPTDMEPVYTHKVRYTDLDKSHHMNNIKYVNLFMNAFSPDFYRENKISVFEINYLSQSFYGEELTVYSRQEDGYINLLAVNSNGESKASARFEICPKCG